MAMSGSDMATYTRERAGMSAFVLRDGVVYHADSTSARDEAASVTWTSGSIAPSKGRNETGVWWRRHDEYDKR